MAAQGTFVIPASDSTPITIQLTGLASAKFLEFAAVTDTGAAMDSLGTPAVDAIFCRGFAGPGTPIKQYAFASVIAQGADYSVAESASVQLKTCVLARIKPDQTTAGKLSVSSISGTGPDYTVTLAVDEQFDVAVRVLYGIVTETGVSANFVEFNPPAPGYDANLGAGADAMILATAFTTDFGVARTSACFGMGYAAATVGGVTDQFCSAFEYQERTGTGNTVGREYSRLTHALAVVNPSTNGVGYVTASAFTTSNCTVTAGGMYFVNTKILAILLSGVSAKVGSITSKTTSTSPGADTVFPASALGWTPFFGLADNSGCTDRTAETSGAIAQWMSGRFVYGTQTQSMCLVVAKENSANTDTRVGYRTTGIWWHPGGAMVGGGKIGVKTGGFADPTTFKQSVQDDLATYVMGLLLLGPKAASLTAGTVSETSKSATSVALSCTDPSGGTAPITQQLWRKPRGGAAGDYAQVAGATSLTPTDDTVVAGTRYTYKIVFTDGASATADSNELDVDVPQVGRPTTIVTQGSWTGAASAINEVTRNDATYIQSSASPVTPDLFRVRLTALSTPATRTAHVVKYAIAKDAAGGDAENLTVRLSELVGGVWTARATWVHGDVADGFQLITQTLTAGQASAIVDYSNLALEFEVVKG